MEKIYYKQTLKGKQYDQIDFQKSLKESVEIAKKAHETYPDIKIHKILYDKLKETYAAALKLK